MNKKTWIVCRGWRATVVDADYERESGCLAKSKEGAHNDLMEILWWRRKTYSLGPSEHIVIRRVTVWAKEPKRKEPRRKEPRR